MPYSNIAESLLEMHYFRALLRHYRHTLGHTIQFFNPATAAEHWYGFDEAFFVADIPRSHAIQDLRAYIHSGALPTFTVFRAFLLQFKVVEMVRRRSANSPPDWLAPYYRSELSLFPNKTTRISQHETLRRLTALSGASVAYVCPMIFEESDVLARPDLADLRFVDVASSPDGWLTTQPHFIAFQNLESLPTWFSQPVSGKALSMDEIIRRAKPMNANDLLFLLDKIRKTLSYAGGGEFEPPLISSQGSNVFPASLSIVAGLPYEPNQA